jgi:hypothetical protein
MGVLAQDVHEAFPEAIVRNRLGYMKVDYAGLVGALVEAIKELADRVEQLESDSSESHVGRGRTRSWVHHE